MSIFETLNKVNVNGHTEKKNGLTYLSWAWAWAEAKKAYPDSFYTIYENKDGLFYHTDGKTAWVKTGVTVVDGEKQIEAIEYLPVMDNRNKSIPVDAITSFDVNKAIQRSLTKALARHGLGLYIYAGEDLPENTTSDPIDDLDKKATQFFGNLPTCEHCDGLIEGYDYKGRAVTAEEHIQRSKQKYNGHVYCMACIKSNAV